MRKMEFLELVNDPDLSYYRTCRMGAKKSRDGIAHTLFYLEKPLDDDKRQELLSKFNNIVFLQTCCQYAPEIRHDVIALYDKKIK